MDIYKKFFIQLISGIVLLSLFPASFWIAYNHEGAMVQYQIDKIIHFCAGFLVALIITIRMRMGFIGVVIVAFLVGVGWEIFEYYATIAFHWPLTDFSREHYMLDTLLDQVAVSVGAILWGVAARKTRLF